MVEKNTADSKIFTPEEKRKLASIKKDADSGADYFGNSTPLITDNAINKLRNVLEIDKMRQEEETGEEVEETAYSIAYKIAEGYMQDFSVQPDTDGAKSLVRQLERWQRKNFPRGNYTDYYTNPQDASLVGFFLVFKAYDIETKGKLTENLTKFSPKEVMDVFDRVGLGIGDSSSIAERSLSGVKIPDTQFALSEFLDEFIDLHSENIEIPVEKGAILASKIIEKLWPKLEPKK
jgi:hypothetical protein